MADTRSRGGKKTGRGDPRNPGKRASVDKTRSRIAQKGKAGGPKPNAGKSRTQKAGRGKRKQVAAFPAIPEMMPLV